MKLKTVAIKAFTLIEVLLVIGFVALAAAGVYVTYSKVDTAAKVNTEANYINTLAAGTRKLYSGSPFPATGTDLVPSLAQARMIPDRILSAGVDTTLNTADDKINNSFGGTMTVVSRTIGTALGFEIALTSIPPEVCTALTSQLQLSFTVVKAGVASATTLKDSTTAFSPATAATTCGAATTNIVTFQGL